MRLIRRDVMMGYWSRLFIALRNGRYKCVSGGSLYRLVSINFITVLVLVSFFWQVLRQPGRLLPVQLTI